MAKSARMGLAHVERLCTSDERALQRPGARSNRSDRFRGCQAMQYVPVIMQPAQGSFGWSSTACRMRLLLFRMVWT